MATDIKISELNEITINSDLNHIVVNDREDAADEGITKKIRLENFLTPNIVKNSNIINSAVTRDKIEPLAVDCSRIACNTITEHQIALNALTNDTLANCSVDNRTLNNCCSYTVKSLVVDDGALIVKGLIDGCLAVCSGITKLNTIRYFWPQSQTAGHFLHTDGNGTLSWREAVPGESTALVFEEIMPVGTIIPWAGTGNVPDDKFLECNGGTFNGTQYPDLSAALGDTWGTHSGVNYYLPNLEGRVPIGEGIGTDTNGNSCNFNYSNNGSKHGGAYGHKLTSAESGMPSHRHQLGIPRDSNGSANNFALVATPGSDEAVKFEHYSDNQSADATNFHNNIQPHTVVRYVIKAKKDSIQQFNPTVGPGLSAMDANGQTNSLTLTGTEFGVKIDNNNLQFNGSNAITLKDDISITSLTATSIHLPDTTPTNSANSTLVDTTKQGLAFPFSKYFETTFVQPNHSTATITPITHGLGGKPTFTYVTLECTTAEHGYQVGDEIPFNSPNNISNNHGPTLYFDSTTFKWRTYGHVWVTSQSTGSVVKLTYNSWKWRIKAWR